MAAEPTPVPATTDHQILRADLMAYSDRELLESIYTWQQGANEIIRGMQEKMGELMENPMLQNLLSMMG